MNGLDCFFAGFRAIFSPGLKRYVVIPFLINLLLFSGLVYYAYSVVDGWIGGMISWVPDFLVEYLAWFLWPLFFITLLGFLFYGFTILANIVAAPFNAVLAVQVEKRERGGHSGSADITWYQVLPRTLGRELAKIMYYLPRLVGLILISLVPPINLVAPFLWVLFGAWMMTIQYADYAADNNGLTFQELKISMSRNRSQSFSFGIAVYLMMAVPFVNLIVIPAAVAGGTILWVRRLNN